VTPVGYPAEIIGKKYGALALHLYSINPLVGVVNGFRWSLGGSSHVTLDWSSVGISAVVILVLALSGLRYFRATEDNFADII
jgi:lipopolysaccharide transport system permease protein